MELRPGYKQTKVRLIPADWEWIRVADLAEFANGKPYEGDVDPLGCYALITLDSVGIDGGLKADHRRIGFLDNSLAKDDIVIILSDLAHGNLLGLCDLIPEADKYVLNQRVGRLRVKRDVSPQFLRFQINARQDYFKKRGQGTSQRHIYRRDIDALAVPMPQMPEQRAIAAVLSDVDALLAKQAVLIAKKRDLKQAALQQLLTGQFRLPGFRGEWGVKRVGELCRITTGKKDVNEGNPNGQFPFFTCSRTHTYSDSFSFDTEAILIAGNGDVGNLHYYNGKFEAYQRTYVLSDFLITVGYLWQQLTAHLIDSLGIGKIGTSIP